MCVLSLQEVYFKKHKFNTVPKVQLKNVDGYVAGAQPPFCNVEVKPEWEEFNRR